MGSKGFTSKTKRTFYCFFESVYSEKMENFEIDKKVLYAQHSHWENTFTRKLDMMGSEPSYSAKKAVKLFRKKGIKKILELGGGQGRDAIYFAQNGFYVYVLDFSKTGLDLIKQKAKQLKLQNITTLQHDVRNALPFKNESIEGCYSHMLYCMALTTGELEFISEEIKRVLKPGGLNIYTVRNIDDSHYRKGIHRGEDMYESQGFIVHFFNKEKVEHLAKGYEIESADKFEEGKLPRKLFLVVLSKKS